MRELDMTPCANCGGARHLHVAMLTEMQGKYGRRDLCYCKGDGGCPGPDCGKKTCDCPEFVAAHHRERPSE